MFYIERSDFPAIIQNVLKNDGLHHHNHYFEILVHTTACICRISASGCKPFYLLLFLPILFTGFTKEVIVF